MQIEAMQLLEDLPRLPSLKDCMGCFGDVPGPSAASWTFPENAGPAKKMAIVVGPEGGLDDSERNSLLQAGWVPCHLGKRILRIETAAILLASQAARLIEQT
jgi:RsmE family RNA methyltransferase